MKACLLSLVLLASPTTGFQTSLPTLSRPLYTPRLSPLPSTKDELEVSVNINVPNVVVLPTVLLVSILSLPLMLIQSLNAVDAVPIAPTTQDYMNHQVRQASPHWQKTLSVPVTASLGSFLGNNNTLSPTVQVPELMAAWKTAVHAHAPWHVRAVASLLEIPLEVLCETLTNLANDPQLQRVETRALTLIQTELNDDTLVWERLGCTVEQEYTSVTFGVRNDDCQIAQGCLMAQDSMLQALAIQVDGKRIDLIANEHVDIEFQVQSDLVKQEV